VKRLFLYLFLSTVLVAGTVELALQTIEGESNSWTDHSLITFSEERKTQTADSESSITSAVEPAELRIALTSLTPLPYSTPPDSQFTAIVSRMIHGELNTKATLQTFTPTSSENNAPRTPPIATISHWNPDLVVLVIDDYWLFETHGLIQNQVVSTSTFKIHNAIRAVSVGAASAKLYNQSVFSTAQKQNWRELFAKLERDGGAPCAVLIIPTLNPTSLTAPLFREHHQFLQELAEKHSFFVINLSDQLLPLPSLRTRTGARDFNDMSEIAHRVSGEALYKGLHTSGLLPESHQIKRFYSSRSDIRLLDERRLLLERAD
jgi:hypothetical protein